MDAEFEWDFFIAHAGPDLEIAKSLYLLLKDRSKVFLDACSIELGSDWDTNIASAQMKSRVMVVLVSAKTPQAYYQREEIATAIVLARKEGSSQKLVPVFLDSDSVTSEGIPYGLRIKHGLIVGVDLSLQSVADRLIGLIAHKIPTSDKPALRREQLQSSGVELPDPWSPNPGEVLRRILIGGQNLKARSAELHWKIAVLFARMHRNSEALEALEYGDSLGSANDQLRLLYGGFVFLRARRHKEGETLLRQFIKQEKTHRRGAAIAFDLLGAELRRQLKIEEAEDRFKSALRLKRKADDFSGQGITLGNLGRISLYSMRPHDAITYFQQNVTLTQKHAPESEGIARNSLGEAYVAADQANMAATVVEPILKEPARFTPRDCGFAQVVLAEGFLSTGDFRRASTALNRATVEFERCAEGNGLFLVEELEGLVALSNGWRMTAEKRFKSFDTKLRSLGDELFSIYRWRRRAFLAALQAKYKTVAEALATARDAAIGAGLPSEDIDTELREFRKITQGIEPALGSKPWFVYWQVRSPRPLADSLRMMQRHRHPLGLFLLAERASEFFEAILSNALGTLIKPSNRRSFGAKVQSLRTVARRWCEEQSKSRKSWEELIRSFESLVEMRNVTVHPDFGQPSLSDEEVLVQIQSILRFASTRTRIVDQAPQCDDRSTVRGATTGNDQFQIVDDVQRGEELRRNEEASIDDITL